MQNDLTPLAQQEDVPTTEQMLLLENTLLQLYKTELSTRYPLDEDSVTEHRSFHWLALLNNYIYYHSLNTNIDSDKLYKVALQWLLELKPPLSVEERNELLDIVHYAHIEQELSSQITSLYANTTPLTGAAGSSTDLANLINQIGANNQELTEATIKLSLSEAQARTLCSSLARNTNLRTLNFTGCSINGEIAEAFAKAIEENELRIRTITFMNCAMEVDSARLLAEAIEHNSSIREVSITHKNLPHGARRCFNALATARPDLAIALPGSNRTYTQTESNRVYKPAPKEQVLEAKESAMQPRPVLSSTIDAAIGINEFRAFCDVLKDDNSLGSLTVTDSVGRGISPDHIINLSEALKSNKAIKKLVLKGVRIHNFNSELNHIAKLIAANTPLKVLNLHNTCITDEGIIPIIVALENNSTLETLNLRGNPSITDESAERLYNVIAQSHSLKTVNLEGTSVSDELKASMSAILSSRPQAEAASPKTPSWEERARSQASESKSRY